MLVVCLFVVGVWGGCFFLVWFDGIGQSSDKTTEFTYDSMSRFARLPQSSRWAQQQVRSNRATNFVNLQKKRNSKNAVTVIVIFLEAMCGADSICVCLEALIWYCNIHFWCVLPIINGFGGHGQMLQMLLAFMVFGNMVRWYKKWKFVWMWICFASRRLLTSLDFGRVGVVELTWSQSMFFTNFLLKGEGQLCQDGNACSRHAHVVFVCVKESF